MGNHCVVGVLSGAVLLVLSGCSCSVEDTDSPSGTPDGGGGQGSTGGEAPSGGQPPLGTEVPGPIESVWPESCGDFAVIGMSPAPDSNVLPPKGHVELIFSKDIDPTSVSDTSIVLRERESKRTVPLTFEVAGNIVRLIPTRPLGIRARYNVEATGIAWAHDPSCAIDHSARFFTDPNFEAVYKRWVGGVANVVHVFSWDGQSQLYVDHYVPGVDGELLTADDVQVVSQEYNYDELWDLKNVFTWTDAGTDDAWGTVDDFAFYNMVYAYDPAGLHTQTMDSFGADGLVGTSDDSTAVTTSFYDDQDRFIGRCDATSCLQVKKANGESVSFTSVDPGQDGIWMTSDDVLGGTWTRTVDGANTWVTQEVHTLAADGTPTVSAGSLVSYQDNLVVDAQSREVRAYVAAGDDGVWRSGDDVGDTITYANTDTKGLRTSTIVFTSGPDGLLGTDDDVLYSETTY